MVKHNNVVPNAHFHKEWQKRVKTWFDQPARKLKRRNRRAAKAAQIAPRPTKGFLRPLVMCPTARYNTRERYGRGFTPLELKEAGIDVHYAPTIGIAVDHRRHNFSDEGLTRNVERLKGYMEKVVVFPKKASKPKKGDASAEDIANATQHTGVIMPSTRKSFVSTGKVSDFETEGSVFTTLRVALADDKLAGKRLVRKRKAAEAAELEALRKKK